MMLRAPSPAEALLASLLAGCLARKIAEDRSPLTVELRRNGDDYLNGFVVRAHGSQTKTLVVTIEEVDED